MRTNATNTVETIVIGAGPAGLTCAYSLAKAGRDVLVLEADPEYVGGISRTVNYKGYLFDIGGHRFFSKSKDVVDLWNEILPDDFIERRRLSRIYYRNKFYAYPLRAFEALRKLGIVESVACMVSFAYAQAIPIRNPSTFHQWVRNQFGERLFSIFFKTYTEKVWGISCDEISADWAAQRIKGLDLLAAVLDGTKRSLGVRGKSSPGAPKTLIESFRYPRRGPGMMWDACASKIAALGGSVLKGRRVVGAEWDSEAGRWRVTAVRSDGAAETYVAENLVSSAPMREMAGMLSPRPASRVLASAKALRYRDFLTVVLIGRSGADMPDNWVYIHDPTVRVGRVQNFASWSPEMIPEPGMVCMGLEYFCSENDELWSAPDQELIRLAKREISRIGLLAVDDIVDASVVRQARAYPVYDKDYRDNVAVIRDAMSEGYPTLHLVGRNGMHKYNNQDHAMMTGLLTALNIDAGEARFDHWAVNEDAEYAEEGVEGARAALASARLVPSRVAA